MRKRVLLGIGLGALFLVACSTSSREAAPKIDAPQATAVADSGSPAAAPQAVQPRSLERPRGGKLVRLFSDPPTLDPHLTTDTVSGAIVQEVFGGLVTIDPQIQIKPDLAERWEIDSGGRVYTFRLRRDAKFHQGKPVTAEDLRWSLERAADPATESPVADQYLGDIVGVSAKLNGKAQTIEGLRIIDTHTVALTIDAPKAYFLAKLTYPTGFVLDRANVEGSKKDWFFRPNGTGPFKLSRYAAGEALVLGRNANYHLGPPFLDEVQLILSGGDPMLMYENNEIHLTGVGLEDLERLQDPANPLRAELRMVPPSFSVSYIGMNVNQPPFDDARVRQALNLAINKKGIATTVLKDLRVPAKGVIPPGFPSYNPNLPGYGYDAKTAKRLLGESRYGQDLAKLPRITLSLAGDFGASVGLDIEAMLRSWQQELGVQVEVQQTEWATFLQDLNRRRFQMFAVGWGADYPDPENFLDILFHSKSRNNHMAYSNPQVDSLLEQARVDPDQTSRFQLYNRIEQMILDDAPWIPLWHSNEQPVLIKPQVKDYYLVPMTIPKLRYVYFAKN